MSHFLDYHVLYHHNQGEVEQMIDKSFVRIYMEGEKVSVWLCQSVSYKF